MGNDFLTGGAADNCVYEDNIQQSDISEAGKIIAPIGTTADGELSSEDISQIPHFLVCGFSGTGKTSFIQAVLTSIATHYSPEKVRFLIYDSKHVDYNDFNELPHLIIPVITDDKKVEGIISWLALECKRRLKLLAESSVRNITTYNKKNAVSDGKSLSHLFVILDDYSSLQLDDNIAALLLDVLKNGRPVGIHFVFVTSLVSSKAIRTDILPNVPCRISFCVSTRADSRIAIGQYGAEHLYVPGELIFRLQNKLVRCQGVYMADDDTRKVIKKLQRQDRKNLDTLGNTAAQIFENSSIEQSRKAQDISSYDDELFSAAVDIVLEMGSASASLLQRRLKLGYSSAARLVDMMEDRGIIGPFEGSKPRRVLIAKAQWQAQNDANKYCDNHVDTSNYSASSDNTTLNAIEDDDETPDIELRSFAQFSYGDIGFCIEDNQIKISSKIITKYGPGTTTASFNGKSVAGLVYKKPRMFSHGYIQFIMKPHVEIVNGSPDLITITKDNLSNIMKVEFDNNISNTMKVFMTQISQDIGVPLNEL